MRKVLLVIEEIQPLVGLETFLRRLGFDVLSLSKDALADDAILGFPAEIVIASHHSRHVDGVKLSQRLKKKMVPPPRIALSYSGARPTLTLEDQKSVDAMMEIPAAGENAIRLLAQLGGISPEPLLEKYRKFSTAKLTSDEQIVIIQGERSAVPASVTAKGLSADWDPKSAPGKSAEVRSERSTGYDSFLEHHAKDLANGAADKVMPRDRANQHMKKLKEDSLVEKALLEEIQKQKIKFAEAMFQDGPAEKSPGSSHPKKPS